jgi:hypothetical protein
MACDRHEQELKQRMVRAAAGTAFVAYGLYLMPFFHGGMVFLTYLVFVIPIALGIQYFRERADYKLQQEMEALTRQYVPGSPFRQSDGDSTTQTDV